VEAVVAQEGRGRRIARWALAGFYGLAGIGHLVFTEAMVRIVPAFVPAPRVIVIVTGLLELVGAIALAHPRWRKAGGWGLAAYALCVWPANVQHAMLDLSVGSGLPLAYHAPRLLLQPLIVWWALWASGALIPGRPSAGRKRRSPRTDA
jgi:uncharacterized membrane protein